MSAVSLTNVVVLNNPCKYTDPFQFEVTFECIQPLEDDLEWKILYVGSAEDESKDQVLEEIFVGPVPIGTNRFVFQAPAPDTSKIPAEDIIGVTVVLITCSYKAKEFVRVGYYVNNDYLNEELMENPPEKVDLSLLRRSILADKPRVTRFPIDWNPSSGGDSHLMDEADEARARELAERPDDLLLYEEEGEEEEEDEEEEDGEMEDEEMEEDMLLD